MNEYGKTPLMDCMVFYPGYPRDHLKKITNTVAKKLIVLGADIHFKDKNGQTALDFAVQNNNKEMVEILASL